MPAVDTINKRIQLLAEDDPNKKSFCFISVENTELTLSRQQLYDYSRAYASSLKRIGIKKGEVICSMLANSRTRIVVDMGILMAGGVVSNGLITLADGQDFFDTLTISKSTTVVTSRDHTSFHFLQKYFLNTNDMSGTSTETIIPIQCDKAPYLKQVIVYQLRSHEDHTHFLAGLDDEDFFEAGVTAEDEAYIFFTSGSTGLSKLIPRTHRECLAIVDSQRDILYKQDVFYNDRPFGWLGGFPHHFLSNGIPILVQELFDGIKLRTLVDIWEVVLKLGASAAIPFALDLMKLKQIYEKGIFRKRIGSILVGGQPVTKSVLKAASQVCERIITLYGSVDAGVGAYGITDSKNVDSLQDFYIGNNYPCLQIRLVDENSTECLTEPNRVGDIHLKGKTVLRRFLNTNETSTLFTKDGWLNTNDTGFKDEYGNLYVIGRKNDVIINGPLNIYPQWIEERIMKCPGVESVVIIGLPHPIDTQELCVCIVKEKDSTLTLADLKQFCQAMFLDGALNFACVPDRFVIMDSFPLLPTGKVNRKEVEKLATEHFKTKHI